LLAFDPANEPANSSESDIDSLRHDHPDVVRPCEAGRAGLA
jgi:hypothetical protein